MLIELKDLKPGDYIRAALGTARIPTTVYVESVTATAVIASWIGHTQARGDFRTKPRPLSFAEEVTGFATSAQIAEFEARLRAVSELAARGVKSTV